MTRNAQGPYIVKLEWRPARTQHHPSVTFEDGLPSAGRAIEVGMKSLVHHVSPELTCTAAWWREVQPGEPLDSGRDTWHLISRNGLPTAAGARR